MGDISTKKVVVGLEMGELNASVKVLGDAKISLDVLLPVNLTVFSKADAVIGRLEISLEDAKKLGGKLASMVAWAEAAQGITRIKP